MTQSIEQQRAAFALAQIQSIAERSPDKYVSYVSSMPARIYMNGLGQTIATMLASAGRQQNSSQSAHYLVCQHLTEWLNEQEIPCGITPLEPIRLIYELMNAEQHVYMKAQVESLAFLDWLKKFARALLKETERTKATEEG